MALLIIITGLVTASMCLYAMVEFYKKIKETK
jgi:hypothetical protein